MGKIKLIAMDLDYCGSASGLDYVHQGFNQKIPG